MPINQYNLLNPSVLLCIYTIKLHRKYLYLKIAPKLCGFNRMVFQRCKLEPSVQVINESSASKKQCMSLQEVKKKKLSHESFEVFFGKTLNNYFFISVIECLRLVFRSTNCYTTMINFHSQLHSHIVINLRSTASFCMSSGLH